MLRLRRRALEEAGARRRRIADVLLDAVRATTHNELFLHKTADDVYMLTAERVRYPAPERSLASFRGVDDDFMFFAALVDVEDGGDARQRLARRLSDNGHRVIAVSVVMPFPVLAIDIGDRAGRAAGEVVGLFEAFR